MDENKLNSILEDHYKWLLSDYKDGSRANLRDAENISFIPFFINRQEAVNYRF